MTTKRIHREIHRTPEEQEEIRRIRERFQSWRPGPEEMLASGDVSEFVTLGQYLDLRKALQILKRHRESQGLSLADVAERSGMDKAAVSRLENGVQVNPTVDTLYRYAAAVGAKITWGVRVVKHDDE